MKSDLLATSPLLILPLLAFFLFLVVFLTVFFVTMARKAMAYDPIARLPFEGDGLEDGSKNAFSQTNGAPKAHICGSLGREPQVTNDTNDVNDREGGRR